MTNPVAVVAKKEIKQILKNRSLIIGMIFFMGVFGGITSLGAITSIAGEGSANTAASLGTLIMYVVLVMGVFTGYFFSSQAFLREKTEGTIETMLCSPLSLKDIWLGKVLGVTIPAYAVTIIITVILIAISNIEADIVFLPSPAMILYFIIVVPVYTGCAVGLLGFVQLLLGMKENQIINVIMIFGFIAFISVFDALISDEVIFMTPAAIILMSVFGFVLIAIVRYLTGFLSREKIVTTIP